MNIQDRIKKIEDRIENLLKEFTPRNEIDLRFKPLEEMNSNINKVIFSIIMILITAVLALILKGNNVI